MSKQKTNTILKQQQNDKQLDSFFNKLHSDGNFHGNVLIAKDDTVIYKGSFGMADYTTGQKLNDTSVFELASVSKQFTAMGIVLLKESGKIKYEDSLRYFFPELPYSNITVKHLLHHTSGLPDYMEPVMKATATGSIATNADMIKILAAKNLKPLFKPGEKWEYSNTGYALLASIIEKVSGRSFGDFLKENIFTPLGMTQSQVYRRRFEKRKIGNYALGYVNDEKSGKPVLPDSSEEIGQTVIKLDGITGDGTVNSTVGDLLKWSLALDRHLLVSKAVQDEIFLPGKLNNGKAHAYGNGWMIDSGSVTGPRVWHTGGWPGYGTLIEKHLDNKITVIILSNHDQPAIPFSKMTNLIYGIKEEPLKEMQLGETALKEYTGVYELDPSFKITITVENGKIYEQATGQGKLEIFPYMKDMFFLKAVEATIKFKRNPANQITGLILLQNGQQVPGEKIQ